MKDIITIGVVNCAPLGSKIGEKRVLGYIRALAKRGVELIVFPALDGIRMERVQEAAAKYEVIVSDQFTELDRLAAYADPLEEGLDGFTVLIATVDLSEAKQEGAYE